MGLEVPRTISLVGMHYAPEPSGNAPYTAGLAQGLARRGYVVRVLAGTPHYPQWSIYSGFGQWRRSGFEEGVAVTRVRHYVAKKPNSATRAIMETTFGVRAAIPWAGLGADVVVCVSPPLLGSGLVAIRRRKSVPAGLWIQDLYSRGVVEMGGSALAGRASSSLERAIIRSYDGVAVAHARFRQHLIHGEMTSNPGSVRVIRNWNLSHGLPGDAAEFRARHGWRDSDIICLHAGNMGKKQGLENLVDSALRAAERGITELKFVLLGDGNQKQVLQERSAGYANVQFLPAMAEHDYITALAAADILLVNERPGVNDMSVPSKLTSYYASGRPIVGAVAEASVTADELRLSGAGLRVDPAAPDELVSQLLALSRDGHLATDLGERGRSYAETHLSEDRALDAFEDWIVELQAKSTSRRTAKWADRLRAHFTSQVS